MSLGCFVRERNRDEKSTSCDILRQCGSSGHKIRENGAVPVLYATWAYQKDGKQLQKFGIDYDEMYRKMHEAYAEAAEKNHTLLADVGSAFYEKTETENLFNDDGSHPNEAGSNLAAETIAEVILKDANA